MARLVAVILSEDEPLKKHLTQLLRSGSTPISVTADRAGDEASCDLVIVDGRDGPSSALAKVERLRAAAPGLAIFFLAGAADSDLILQAMRAGANEFFTWPLDEDAFRDATGRAAARRGAAGGGRPTASVLVFVGAKGGTGTTTVAVNCAVDLAARKRPTIVLDLKPGLGDVSLFLGVRSRYSVLDAIENAHRLDDQFLSGLVAKHMSGLELLPGSDQFDRPGSHDGDTIDKLLQLLGQRYEYIVVDAGSQLNACSLAAFYGSEMIGVVANPDVPSIRNAQRLLERVGELGSCRDRVRVLLNRAAEPYPIPRAQIEEALDHRIDLTFPSDYKTVATALNAGVPLTFSDNSEMAAQFKKLTGMIVDPSEAGQPAAARKKSSLGLPRFASMW